MKNKEKLIEYLNWLCDALNSNGIRNKYKDQEFDWKVDKFEPYITFLGGIYSNGRAFNFLKDNGYLDKGICLSCGASPIDKTYSFHSGLNPNRVFYICKDCYTEGQKSSAFHY